MQASKTEEEVKISYPKSSVSVAGQGVGAWGERLGLMTTRLPPLSHPLILILPLGLND